MVQIPTTFLLNRGDILVNTRQLYWSSFARSAAMLAAIPIICASVMWVSWLNDNSVLRERALAVAAGLTTGSAKIIAINHWVYRNQGFTKNDGFILLPALGPTPIQVLRTGG